MVFERILILITRGIKVDKFDNKNKKLIGLAFLSLLMCASIADATNITIGGMASNIYGSFTSVAKLITAASYLAGLAFAVGAILKFKQHKDNPTQIPIGTPIAMLLIAAALLFLPTILGIAGQTIFGGGTTAGPTGTIFS